MLDAIAGAGPAVVARCPPAVLEAHGLQGITPVLPQEVPVETRRKVVPGKGFVLGAMAVDHLFEG